MRSIVGIFGTMCGIIAVAIVARYGFMSADTKVDGLITAFLFGAIATGGLGGHAVAVRVWRHSWPWSIIIGVVSAAALFVNLSNSLGFIAGRGEKGLAERAKSIDTVASDKAELARITKDRKSIPVFAITTKASVTASQSAVDSAARIRQEECKQRGPRCRDRELEEQAAHNKLVEVTEAQAATERASRLDTKIASLRAKIATAKPIGKANPQGEALKLIFQLFQFPKSVAESASTYQQFAVAAIVELLIVMSFVAFELIGREVRAAKSKPKSTDPTAEILNEISKHLQKGPRRAKPKLVTSDGKRSGSVPDIMADILEPAKGERIEIEDGYRAYQATCANKELRPVSPDKFIEAMQVFCARCEIETDVNEDHVLLLGVKITSKGQEMRETVSARTTS